MATYPSYGSDYPTAYPPGRLDNEYLEPDILGRHDQGYDAYSAGLGNSPNLRAYDSDRGFGSSEDFDLGHNFGNLDLKDDSYGNFHGNYGPSPNLKSFDDFDYAGPSFDRDAGFEGPGHLNDYTGLDDFNGFNDTGHDFNYFGNTSEPIPMKTGKSWDGNQMDPLSNLGGYSASALDHFPPSFGEGTGGTDFGSEYGHHMPFSSSLPNQRDFGDLAGRIGGFDADHHVRFKDDLGQPSALDDYMLRQDDRSDPYGLGAMTLARPLSAFSASEFSDHNPDAFDRPLDRGLDDFDGGHYPSNSYEGSSFGFDRYGLDTGNLSGPRSELYDMPSADPLHSFGRHSEGPLNNFGATHPELSHFDRADYFGGSLHDDTRSLHDEAVYDDLLMFQNQLLSNEGLDEASREQRFNERLRFEELSEHDRASQWNTMPDQTRWSLGLNQGIYGSRFGGDHFFERQLNHNMLDGRLNSAYPLNSPVLNQYSSYFSPDFHNQMHNASYMDPDFMRASDLAAYSNALKVDQSIAESEKLRRWQERLSFEALAESQRADRYRTMAEEQRMRIGLGRQGLYGTMYNFDYTQYFQPQNFQPLAMPLSSRLSTLYKPYFGQRFDAAYFRRPDWENRAAYYDLQRYENELRRAKRLNNQQRMRLWKERLAFQEMNEANRRMRWLRMSEKQKRLLGLDRRRFFGSRYQAPGLGYGTRGRYMSPKYANEGLRYALPSGLRRRYGGFEKRKPTGFLLTNHPTFLTSADPAANRARERIHEQQQRERMRIRAHQEHERNRRVSAQRHRAEQSRKLLERMDRERALANGHVTSAKTWRAPVR